MPKNKISRAVNIKFIALFIYLYYDLAMVGRGKGWLLLGLILGILSVIPFLIIFGGSLIENLIMGGFSFLDTSFFIPAYCVLTFIVAGISTGIVRRFKMPKSIFTPLNAPYLALIFIQLLSCALPLYIYFFTREIEDVLFNYPTFYYRIVTVGVSLIMFIPLTISRHTKSISFNLIMSILSLVVMIGIFVENSIETYKFIAGQIEYYDSGTMLSIHWAINAVAQLALIIGNIFVVASFNKKTVAKAVIKQPELMEYISNMNPKVAAMVQANAGTMKGPQKVPPQQPQVKRIYCPRCKNTIEGQPSYCPHCGQKFNWNKK